MHIAHCLCLWAVQIIYTADLQCIVSFAPISIFKLVHVMNRHAVFSCVFNYGWPNKKCTWKLSQFLISNIVLYYFIKKNITLLFINKCSLVQVDCKLFFECSCTSGKNPHIGRINNSVAHLWNFTNTAIAEIGGNAALSSDITAPNSDVTVIRVMSVLQCFMMYYNV